MSLEEKIAGVEAVFAKLDGEIADFQARTTLHCKFGCGKCCFKADIEATVLEFLPFAYHLYKEGSAEDWHRKLLKLDSKICVILNPTQPGSGLCSDYKYRGLICRLFGYSARTDKYSKKELVTCQVIKEEQAEGYGKAVKMIEGGGEVPVMSSYYMQLHSVDGDLARDFYPINIAIRKAIETVLHNFAYRDQ